MLAGYRCLPAMNSKKRNNIKGAGTKKIRSSPNEELFMKSPFPGMDPFIEACGLWEDFHGSLIHQIGDTLADTVSERYLVRKGERSYVLLVAPEGKESHHFMPDVGVTAHRRRRRAPKKGGTALAEITSAVEPVTMRPFIQEEHREAFIEIYEASPQRRLVTAIEVFSPSNKRPGTEAWDLYMRKRQSPLLGQVNLLEIDLLRGGQRMPMLDPWPDSPYTLLVSRANGLTLCKAWPAYAHVPLPVIPVPLLKPDPDIPLDLQPLIQSIYQRYRYHETIDYRKRLRPRLTPEESACLKRQSARQR
jgi:hypothetical protein